jgi:hypothetical protein
MNPTPPMRLPLDKIVVRVLNVPLRRPIVAKLGEFKTFPKGAPGRSGNERRSGPSFETRLRRSSG